MSSKYMESGVDLEAGYKSVELIKKHVSRTNPTAMIGSFGGMFDLSKLNYKEPVLVSGTDGVGTKLEIAYKMNKHDSIGIDLVAMCVNDIIAQGAKPLYFLDYIAISKNIPTKIEQIVKGIADGCIQAGCSLIGGETAEMPDIYTNDQYDLAGFTVGCVEKSEIITGEEVEVGNKLVGVASSGLHSNGFSLVRKILFKDNTYDLEKRYDPFEKTLGEVLLTPTKIYVEAVLKVLEGFKINGIVHVTGGGFYENIPRVLNNNQGVNIYKNSFEVLDIFKFLQTIGNISDKEMYNVFNMGIGLILIVDSSKADNIVNCINKLGEKAYVIGEVTSEKGVELL
ncbi:MAG: phosphoribosylformylglycinamidine cyclo-ligase [Bacilli bacterium]